MSFVFLNALATPRLSLSFSYFFILILDFILINTFFNNFLTYVSINIPPLIFFSCVSLFCINVFCFKKLFYMYLIFKDIILIYL